MYKELTRFRPNYSFSARLLLGLLILVLLTTFSAGLPAYWLTRTQLEQQTWSHVNTTRHATLSLFQAEKNQLKTTALLLAERPTLQRLLLVPDRPALAEYLQAFRDQSQLDFLLVCDPVGLPLAGEADLAGCPAAPALKFDLVQSRPVLLASRPVYEQNTDQALGRAVVGIWLDQEFVRQMAANTGGQQSILLADGTRLASSFTTQPTVDIPTQQTSMPDQQVLDLAEGRFYAAYFPLTDSDDQTSLLSEVALPVDPLIATEKQALTVLVASTGLVALVGVALGGWYIRRLIAPLQQLTRVSEQISQGEFMTHIPSLAAGPVEVTTLAAALKKSQAAMLAALAERSQARDWLNALLQSMVEGVVTFDSRDRITFFSQGAETLTGWPAGEALGRPITQVFPLADDEASFLDRIPSPGKKRAIEIVTRTGRRAVLAVTGARMVPPDGDTVQVALVLRDVTEEEALRHLRLYFLANISHEFRTPLSTLNASIELLLDEVEVLTAAEIRELLKPTHLSLLSLQTLIDNLLESSSIEAGYFSIRKQLINFNQVITTALQIVKPLLERRDQPLSLTEPTYFPSVQADPPRLIQVLVNLLVNASKYSPIGQPIDLRVEQIDDRLRVSVLDRGPGIPPAERVNLFRRFVRLNGYHEEQYGIGLGLYVVKTTIEAHGGQVGVEDREGGGSLFWFELPLTTGASQHENIDRGR